MRVFMITLLLGFLVGVYGKAPQLLSPTDKMNVTDRVQQTENLGLCGTIFITDELVKQALENTRLQKPELYQRMVAAATSPALGKKTAETVGTLRTFFVLNLQTNQFDQVTAELLASGNLTQVWVDTAEINNQHVDQEVADSILISLETKTPPASKDPSKGIVTLEHEYFGMPPNKDGDGKTDFLITDIKDGWQPGGSFIAGFFTSWDQTDNTGSNRRDMLYIDSYPGIFLNGQRNPSRPLGTLAHEYQHLIHYNYDTGEETFVNEGLSEVASVFCGFPLRSPSRYMSNTDIPLFDWDNRSGDVLADYSRAALFALYYWEQIGDVVFNRLISASVNNLPVRGVSGFNKVLSDLGLGYTFDDLFINFAIANQVDDKNLDPRYGYQYPVTTIPSATYHFTDPNQTVERENISGYAADYIVFAFGDSLKITFESPSSLVQVYALKLGPEVEVVESVPVNALSDPNKVTYEVPEMGSTVSTVVFIVTNVSTVSSYYKFTSTGKQKAFFVEQKYDDGSPDKFFGSATFLGFGNDREGSGWAVKFVPEIPENQLIGARMLAAFAQEFSGSNVPSDAPKDFYFHVWESNGGLPGNDLIPPFLFSTDRADFTGNFLDIDLSSYSQQLTNVDTVYIGFIENDTIGTYLGMDNSTKTNYTYGFFGPNFNNPNRWVPMENLSVGDPPASLAGWNMMIRALFTYSDPNPPFFTVGYFQNPIFTEELDIFVVGSSRLSPDKLTVLFTKNNQLDTLNMQVVPNTSEKVLVDNSVTLQGEGPFEIRVLGTTKYGFLFADTTFFFNAQFLTANSGGTVQSPQGEFSIEIPAMALSKNMYIITFEGNTEARDEKLAETLKDKFYRVYSVSPLGTNLTRPAAVSVRIPDQLPPGLTADNLAIATWDGENLEYLPTTVSADGQYLETHISTLGRLVVTENSAITSIDEPIDSDLPDTYRLYVNYPNPFNPRTQIRYDLPKDAELTLTIYDILGRRIKTLVQGRQPAGRYQVVWNGTDEQGNLVSSGVYIYRLSTPDYTKTFKMILAK